MPANVTLQVKPIAFLQTLKDPVLRAAYDQQLAFAAAQQLAFVSQTILLAEMELVQSTAEDTQGLACNTAYQYPCRCGGSYWLDTVAIHMSQNTLLVQCDTCSLNIEVCLV